MRHAKISLDKQQNTIKEKVNNVYQSDKFIKRI